MGEHVVPAHRRHAGSARGSGRRRLLLLVCAATILVGCARIPTSGPIVQGPVAPYRPPDSYVRVLVSAPPAGATPSEIVQGFLQATVDFDNGHAVAREYLTSSAAASWQPATGVTVYADNGQFSIAQKPAVGVPEPRRDLSTRSPVAVVASSPPASASPSPSASSSGRAVARPVPSDVVDLAATKIATIDSQGQYSPAPMAEPLSVRFTLEMVSGQWRISALPQGMLLSAYDVANVYRSVDLYFLDPHRGVLVPDPVFLPARPGLSTTLVRRLLAGPTSRLRGAVATAVPAGPGLLSAVPVENGQAQVDLSDSALRAGTADRQAMAAQIVWTLRQLPDVSSVVVSVNGTPLSIPGAGTSQTRSTWASFDPDVLAPNATGYLEHAGRLSILVVREVPAGTATTLAPVAGPVGDGQVRLARAAVSLDGSLVAGVAAGGHTVLVGGVGSAKAPVAWFRGTHVTALSWDRTSGLWILDQTSTGSQIWVVHGPNDARRVLVNGLGSTAVSDLRVSRDGTRVAMIVGATGSRLLLGAVIPGEKPSDAPQVGGLWRVAPGLTGFRSVSWMNADRLAVLATAPGQALAPYLVGVDGFLVASTVGPAGAAPLTGATTVAAGPGSLPLLVGTSSGSVYQLDGRTWALVATDAYPLYPG
ncbi:MAG: LpqB family beta-propeller domain-containing protein [Actinomycetes bacterium]